jgi:fucose permease
LFLATVAAGGMVDVVMNVAGTAALGAQPKRLLRLNAQYNAGALLGAGVSGLLLDRGVSFRAVWVGIAVAAALLAAWVRSADLPAGERGEHHSLAAGFRALTHGGLRPLAVVFSIGALVEGGIGTWGVTFLRSQLGLAVVAGAGAYVVGAALATTARSTLGWTATHLGARRAAQVGLGVAGVGLVVEAVAGNPVVAGAGLAAGALGVSVYWPLLLSHASQGAERPGLVVGGLSACGYVGFLAGPPAVGWVSQATDLRWGVALLGIAALAGSLVRLH